MRSWAAAGLDGGRFLGSCTSTPSDRRYISISSSGPGKSFSTASSKSAERSIAPAPIVHITYAQISNIVSAVRFVPEAIGNVFSAFKGDDEEDNRALLLMLAVVLVAVGAGVMTARAIIPATARKSSQTVLSELQTQHAAT